MVAESAEFKKAVEDSRSLSQTPTNDELLEVRTSQSHARHQPPNTQLIISCTIQIYGLFKQGSGNKFDDAPKPGMFDLKVRLPTPDGIAMVKTDSYGYRARRSTTSGLSTRA
jgi:acyl-CoA-binding protein